MNGFILTIISILAIASIAYLFKNEDSHKEGFWMNPSRSLKVEKMFRNCNKADFYQVPNFQSTLSPRFSNVGYGPNLQGRLPAYGMLGVPIDPLMDTAKSLNTSIVNNPNNFSQCSMAAIPQPISSCKISSPSIQTSQCDKMMMSNPGIEPYQNQIDCKSTTFVGAPGIPLNPHYPTTSYSNEINGNYDKTLNLILEEGANSWPTSTVAEPNKASFINEDGQLSQPIIYDRYIFANKNSRQRGAGDPIRGDLPIVPVSGSWFIPSQANNPGLNLQQGAMNVMGGVNNETSNALANLIWNSSGGSETTIGGVDMANTLMTHQVYGAASAAQGDVIVRTFP
jgi:hypothetical protein